MNRIIYTFIVSLSLSLLSGCSSDSMETSAGGVTPGDGGTTFVEADKTEGAVTVEVSNFDETRAAPIDQPDNNIYTASCCKAIGASYTAVGYHGRNGEQTGMVQIVYSNRDGSNTTYKPGQVLSQLITTDARVNFIETRSTGNQQTLYVGVDRYGDGNVLCGILAIELNKGKMPADINMSQLHPYKVTGLSVNSMKWYDAGAGKNMLLVAAGGNEKGLGEKGLAGFSRFEIDSEDPTKLMLSKEGVSTNYRGYCVSFQDNTPLAYTYRTVEDGDLVFKVGMLTKQQGLKSMAAENPIFTDPMYGGVETEVYRQEGETENKGRFWVSSFRLNSSDYLCVSNGESKEGGLKVYRYDSGSNSLVLAATWDKLCCCTSSIITEEDDNYIFAACGGGGVYKIKVEANKDKSLTLTPVAKRVSKVLTESGTLSSVNYVQVRSNGSDKALLVAGGYEGFYVLSFDDSAFLPTDNMIGKK